MEGTNSIPSDLPAYSPPESPREHSRAPRELTVHTYELMNSKKRPWVVLKVVDKAASSAHLPHIYEGEPIEGTVDLNLEKDVQIKSVSIAVSGEIITTNTTIHTFIRIVKELWSTAVGDPQASALSLTTGSPFKGKLRGQFSWPFSIRLPAEVELLFEQSIRTFKLPASFNARGSLVTVNYRISVNITRGKFQTECNLGTAFAYAPIIRPGPPSIPRQLAYQEHSPLIGLDGDPEGWLTLTPVTVRGTIFSARSIEAIFSLSLAKPLSYTRGTVIPLLLTVECSDSQALDMLARPNGPLIRLKRRLSMKYDGTSSVLRVENRLIDMRHIDKLPATAFRDLVDELQTATWWHTPYMESSTTNSKRHLQGEIHLAKSLPPSSFFGHFQISYHVAMYPPKAVAFIPADGEKQVLQVAAVEIATVHARGPRPLSYSPPNYDVLHPPVNVPSYSSIITA